MDFYQHQDNAQNSSRRLVLLFVLAVVAVLVAINGIGAMLWYFFTGGAALPGHFVATNSFIVALYVIGGAILETGRLADGGGAALAHRIGAKSPNPYDLRHKRLINICEELSLAAGIPVPEVFILDVEPINALAAGPDTAHAAIVVTRGALQTLTREELQGVVGHELAHIVNGDAALNTRLAGALYGLYSLNMFGRSLLGLSASTRGHHGSFALIPLFLVLGSLFAGIGWIGNLCAEMVQAGVSRQREFLADALAVQFTRSRDGLGGALRKISGQGGCDISLDYSEVVSHLWLSTDHGKRAAWFDSHPPLIDRIRRLYGRPLPAINPQTVDVNDDEFERRDDELPPLPFGEAASMALGVAVLGQAMHGSGATQSVVTRVANEPAMLARGVVSPGESDLGQADSVAPSAQATLAARTWAHILLRAVRDLQPSLSKAALIINAIVAGPVSLPEHESGSDDDLYGALLWLEEPTAQWLRVPLIELLVARIRTWPLECRRTLVRYCHDAVLADGRVEKTEWIYFTLVRHRLLPDESITQRKFSAVDKRRALAEVFSMAGHMSEQSARRIRDAVANAAAEIGVPRPASTPEQFEFRSLTRALDVLSTIAPLRKPQLLRALEGLARSPGDAAYGAFLVAVAAAIDCPPLRTSVDGTADQNGAGQFSESQMA